MSQWYCYIQGQQYGPVDEPTVRQWVREGRILPDNMVWNEQLPDWTPAADVPGLMGGGSAAPAASSAPSQYCPERGYGRVFGVVGLLGGVGNGGNGR